MHVTQKTGANEHVAWALRFGDARVQRATSVVVDRSGDIVVAGEFEGTITAPSGTLTSAGSTDIFVAKLAPSGSVRWIGRFGGAGEDDVQSVAVDANGNIALTGSFCGTLDFGGKQHVCARGLDVLVAKLDRDGRPLFSLAAGTEDTHEIGNAIAFDAEGNVLVTGQAQGAVDFGGGALPREGEASVFLVKLDPSGRHVWSKRFGNEEEQVANALAIDSKGNVLVTGRFEGDVDFGGGVLHAAFKDVFLAKYDGAGRPLSSARFGDPTGAGPADGRCVSVDSEGNVILAGVFSSTIDFGGGALTGAGDTDVFVAKLDASGKHLWSKRVGDGSFQSVWALGVDRVGNVALAGSFGGTIDFGGKSASANGKDLFVAKLDPKGAPMWVLRDGDAAAQESRALAIGAKNEIVIAGAFDGTLELSGRNLASQGSSDVFVFALAH